MNLISCDNCGVVFDKDRLVFPSPFDSSGVITDAAEWNGEDYVSSCLCPVCNNSILESQNA